MYTKQSVTDPTTKQVIFNISTFKSAYKAELQNLSEIISKITRRTPAEIEPHLDAMIESLVTPPEQSLSQQSFNPEQWATDMKRLAEGAKKIPVLPSEAFTRESIYQDHD